MEKPRYSVFQRFVHKIIAFRPVMTMSRFIMHHIDKLFLKLSGGRITMSTVMTGLPVLTITTTGAKSGKPRTTPLVYVRDPQDSTRFAIIGSNWGQQAHPAWYHNLKANSTATCIIDGKAGQYSAQELSGTDYDKYWRYAVDMYSGYSLYPRMASERHIPIMLMTAVKPEAKNQ